MTPVIEAERASVRRAAVFIVTVGCLVMLGLALYYLANAMLVEALSKTYTAQSQEAGMNATDKERAEETIKLMRALKDNPDDLATLTGLAHAFLHNNEPARAEVFFARAIKQAPDDPSLLRGLALAQLENNRLTEAETALKHALELGHDAESHYLLAVVYSKQIPEKKEQALEQCNVVLKDANASATLRNHAQSLKETILKKSDMP